MEGFFIPIGLFIVWLIVQSTILGPLEDYFAEKEEKKLEAERAEKERWLNTPEGKAIIERQEKENREQEKERRSQAWRYYQRSLRRKKPKSSTEKSGADNAVYIWEVKGATMFGYQIFKIGHTSWYLEDSRIQNGAYRNGQQVGRIIMARVNGKASDLEAQLLKLGSHPEGFDGLDGGTEYRALTDEELKTAIEMIRVKTRKPKERFLDLDYESPTRWKYRI